MRNTSGPGIVLDGERLQRRRHAATPSGAGSRSSRSRAPRAGPARSRAMLDPPSRWLRPTASGLVAPGGGQAIDAVAVLLTEEQIARTAARPPGCRARSCAVPPRTGSRAAARGTRRSAARPSDRASRSPPRSRPASRGSGRPGVPSVVRASWAGLGTSVATISICRRRATAGHRSRRASSSEAPSSAREPLRQLEP